ncbi:hypothetical protein ACFQ12_10885 [Methylobacterium trifolii]
MQTVSTYTPISGPSSDPVLYGVATALSQMFPPVEHPFGFEESDAAVEEKSLGSDGPDFTS